jgi:hypothetical protein
MYNNNYKTECNSYTNLSHDVKNAPMVFIYLNEIFIYKTTTIAISKLGGDYRHERSLHAQ